MCPYDVFTMGTLSRAERSSLSWIGRLKAWAHGGRQAYVTAPSACHACQLCVEACPEDAIVLAPNRAAGSVDRRDKAAAEAS